MTNDLNTRTIRSIKWNVVSNIVFIFFGIIQTVILARLIAVEIFGIYALGHSIVWITGMVANMGMGSAFLHRSEETENEDLAAAVLFTLKSIYIVIWIFVLLTLTLLFSSDNLFRLTMVVLIFANAMTHMTQAPNSILSRRIQHKRLAIIQMCNSTLTLIMAVALAITGFQLWALLISPVVTAFVSVAGVYLWKPVWRPHLSLDKRIRTYYWKFGSQSMLARVLLHTLDRVDDIWTGWMLGNTLLGFYSQAYTFASYPRRILAESVNRVISGTYAENKTDIPNLRQSFELSNSIIVRAGFLMVAALMVSAPEFIRLVPGEKWMPMLDTFRLLLLFTALDPIRDTTANIFLALGQPKFLIQTRIIQLIILLIGLAIFTPLWGINGVAIAVISMLFAGIGQMLWQAKRELQFAISKIFLIPLICLIASTTAGFLVSGVYPGSLISSDLPMFLLKVTTVMLVYGFLWIIFEYKQIKYYLSLISNR